MRCTMRDCPDQSCQKQSEKKSVCLEFSVPNSPEFSLSKFSFFEPLVNVRHVAARWPACYPKSRTRTQAIATITAKLASLDDAQVRALAEIAEAIDQEPQPVRALSERERALLDQSKADFAAGRSTSLAESIAYVDAQLARRGVPKSTT